MKTWFKSGTWKASCAVCGFDYHADQLKERWDGVYVCDADWEPRNILDFYRPKPDMTQNVAWSQDDGVNITGYIAITSIDSPYTVTTSFREISASASGGNITITLPACSSYALTPGQFLTFIRTDSSVNTVTIQRAGSDLVNGATSITLSGANTIRLRTDGISRWTYF